MKALIVGGTGPSGPFLANGLIERGYKVTIFHRGTHEIPEIVPEVAHIHGDPHFRETIEAGLGDRTFDVVIATYGRIRFVAAALAGKTPCFIAIGGVPSYRGYVETAANFPAGLKVPVPEDAPLVMSEQEQRFSWLIKSTEDAVLNTHPNGVVYRYPYVYGPYQLVPREWCIIRRILDKRRTILLPDGGLSLMTHGYAANLAHAVLLAIDNPTAAAGQIYNCGDEEQLSLRQVCEVICGELNHERPLGMERARHELEQVAVNPQADAYTVQWDANPPPEFNFVSITPKRLRVYSSSSIHAEANVSSQIVGATQRGGTVDVTAPGKRWLLIKLANGSEAYVALWTVIPQ